MAIACKIYEHKLVIIILEKWLANKFITTLDTAHFHILTYINLLRNLCKSNCLSTEIYNTMKTCHVNKQIPLLFLCLLFALLLLLLLFIYTVVINRNWKK